MRLRKINKGRRGLDSLCFVRSHVLTGTGFKIVSLSFIAERALSQDPQQHSSVGRNLCPPEQQLWELKVSEILTLSLTFISVWIKKKIVKDE